MAHYRVTARFGQARKQYRVYDIEADDAAAALRAAADMIPADVVGTVDLVELRVQVDPEAREYGPE